MKIKREEAELFGNILLQAYMSQKPMDDIQILYEKYSNILVENKYNSEKIVLDTVYVMIRVQDGRIDNCTIKLLKNLEKYYEDTYSDQFASVYWNSRLLYEWRMGNVRKALSIVENIVDRASKKRYNPNWYIKIIYVQLLIINERYDEAEELIILIVDFLEDKILDVGFGDKFLLLLSLRITLSMYIYICNKREKKEFLHGENYLLQKIIYCKTVEREILSLLGKYKEGGCRPDDLSEYIRTIRKLAALELRMQIVGESNAFYVEKRRELGLKKEILENQIRMKIPFKKLVKKFDFEDISIPKDAVCVEYFSYYKFMIESPMISENIDYPDGELCNYLVFVICNNGNKISIQNSYSFQLSIEDFNEFMELLSMTEGGKDVISNSQREDEIIGRLQGVIAEPIMEYIVRKKTVYLGLDYILQLLPMDLAFNVYKNRLNLILLDSVRYIREEEKIDITNVDAVVIGNPKYNINEMYSQKLIPLSYSEKESQYIAQILGTQAYIGEMASQQILWKNYHKSIIHLATHGYLADWDSSLTNRNLFLNSYIMLAGYEDWKYGRKNRDYGNGIVSGNDFLCMDLSETKLVTLSACVSALGTAYGLEGLHGMRWAIGVAGAHYSVTALWEVKDYIAAILMIMLYRNLKVMPVGEALEKAKERLREISVSELRDDDLLWDIVCKHVQVDKPRYRPFENWKYWAAFVCYCN